tara:strand:+ start:1345 stop:2049 length:705 start_codon:yes stop_codon:yes gene_type:complete
MKQWQQIAIRNSKVDSPRETCGLIVNRKGKEIYISCLNISKDEDNFIINPDQYAACEKEGQIIGIFHSHPKGSSQPSDADKISCEASKLPWYIYSPLENTWSEIKPSGYKPSLYGRPWIWGLTDCYSFVRDWYKEVKNINLKDYKRSLTPDEFLENPLFEGLACSAGFRELQYNESPEKGDVYLMKLLHPKPSHVAVYVGHGNIAHHCNERLSCIEPYTEFYIRCTHRRYRYVN